MYNPDFKVGEFDHFKMQAGLPSFDKNANLKGNIRDYASINELICLSNMETINAVLINEKVPQKVRLIKLNGIAIQQMKVLNDVERKTSEPRFSRLKDLHDC